MIRKILGLALLGFLVITLAGPVVTILALALVGFIVWNVLRSLFAGDPVSIEKARSRVWRLGRGAYRTGRVVTRVVAHELVYLGGAVGRKGLWLGRAVWETARSEVPIFAGFFLEVLSGAAIGGLLGLAVGWQQEYRLVAVGIGAGTGAVFGVLVGVLNWRSARRRLHTSF